MPSFWRKPESILTLTFLTCATASASPTTPLTGFIDCGNTQVRAYAECYENTLYCTTETLSFSRRAGRTIVPVHGQSATYEVSGRKERALDYRAASWACVRGKHGGHYLVVVMNRANGASCTDCEYARLYDLSGRLVATDRDKPGRDMMRTVLGGPGPHAFAEVYATARILR